MATLSASSSSSSDRNATFRVATREVSLDFSTVGPEQAPNELGTLSDTAFRELLAKFALIPAVKLIDGDPQLVVTAKRGRFLILPSSGKLLLRSASDPQQPYEKFDVAALPSYLDGDDSPAGAEPPPPVQTIPPTPVYASATIPPTPAAPIYGSFPDLAARTAAPTPTLFAPPPVPPQPDAPPPRETRRGLIFALLAAVALTAAGTAWIFYGPADSPPPAAPPAEFDLITVRAQLDAVKKRVAGTYATSGDAGERLLEIRADGTFRYQEFGAGLAITVNRTGTYTPAVRHTTRAPVLRASGLGTIEIRDGKTLLCREVVFTKLP